MGGEPRLADLLSRGPLDRVLLDVRVGHVDAVRAAVAWPRSGSSCAARALRSARKCSAPGTGATSAPRSRCRRCWCRSAWVQWPARSPRAGYRPGARPAIRGTAGSTRRRSSAASSRSRSVAYLAAVYLTCGRAPDRRPGDGRVLPAPCGRRRGRRGCGRVRRHLRPARRCPVHLRRPDVTGVAARHHLGHLWDRVARAADSPRAPRRSTPGDRRGRERGRRLGSRPVAVPAARPA